MRLLTRRIPFKLGGTPATTCRLIALLWVATTAHNATAQRFEKIQLTDAYYADGITAGDINGDGSTDIVSGPFWYEGPTFTKAHAFYPPKALKPEASPSNSMFSFVYDFNGDDRLDILVLGRVHKHEAAWYENPGATENPWRRRFAFERIRGESPTLVRMEDSPGPSLLTHWDGRWGFVSPRLGEPDAPWTFRAIGKNREWPQFYHGQGVGDLDGDGKQDVVLNDGWYRQSGAEGLWSFHPHRFSQGRGGAQMFVYDVDGDGDQDVISALDGHGWGLAWFEQVDADGKPTFRQHRIMGDRSEEAKFGVAFSQPHALALGDINGDGLLDIVTGKRRWAHGPAGDVEPSAEPVVYWFRLERAVDGSVRYHPELIDKRSGVGVQIHVEDVNQDGREDVLSASKLGAFLFLNQSAQ